MMLTREQAAATWCPMVRAGVNRTEVSSSCIADQCAMWRWGEIKQVQVQEVIETPSGSPRFRSVIKAVTVPNTDGRGYCGLAGAPHIAGGQQP